MKQMMYNFKGKVKDLLEDLNNNRKVRIKLDNQVKYEFTNFGYIKAESMIKALYKNEHIKKKNSTVTESIENMLYDNREIEKAYYDTLTNEIELYFKN